MALDILYAGLHPHAPAGGGEISVRLILEAGAAAHRLSGVTLGEPASGAGAGLQIESVGPSPVRGFPWRPWPNGGERRLAQRLAERLEAAAPDLLFLQTPAFVAPAAVPAQTWLVLFLRSPLCFALWDPTPEAWRRALSAPSFRLRHSWYAPMLRRADLIVANSAFMADALRRRTGLESVVVPPAYDAQTAPVPSPADGPVLFNGLDPWKGGALALAIAERLPARRFLFLAGSRPEARMLARAERLRNVEVVPWTEDMAPLYRRCRVVIVPSLWEEPFGRVAIEAGAHGRPVIARAVGGLTEAVGPGGILLEPEATAADWCAAIARLDRPETHARLSAAAACHAQSFTRAACLARLDRALEAQTGFSLGAADPSPAAALLGAGAMRASHKRE